MLVFSSAERTNSLALSLRPFQMRWYKSKIRPAFDSIQMGYGRAAQSESKAFTAFDGHSLISRSSSSAMRYRIEAATKKRPARWTCDLSENFHGARALQKELLSESCCYTKLR